MARPHVPPAELSAHELKVVEQVQDVANEMALCSMLMRQGCIKKLKGHLAQLNQLLAEL